MLRLHATCIAIGTRGVLLMGESGTGKSDLALRLIDRGAVLVADDQVEISKRKTSLVVSAPERIRGLLEVRGLGIFTMPIRKNIKLSLVVRLCGQEWIERLPYPEPCNFLAVDIPQIRLSAFELSAPIKVEMALGGAMKVGALRE
jgi:HPr kinase/phosphorylase